MNHTSSGAVPRSGEQLMTATKIGIAGSLLFLAGCTVPTPEGGEDSAADGSISRRSKYPVAVGWGDAPKESQDPQARRAKQKVSPSATPSPATSVMPSTSPSISSTPQASATTERAALPSYGYVITDNRQNSAFPNVSIYTGTSTESGLIQDVPSGTRFLAACIDFDGGLVAPRPGDGDGPATTTWLGVRSSADGAVHYVSDAYARTESEAMRARLPDCQ